MRVFGKAKPHLVHEKCTKKREKTGVLCEYFLYESNLGCCVSAAQASEVLVILMVGWMLTLVSFSLSRIIRAFGRETWWTVLALNKLCQRHRRGQRFDTPWDGAIFSHRQQHPSKPFPALPRASGTGLQFLWFLCQEQGQSGPETLVQSSVKAGEDYSGLGSRFCISCSCNSLSSNEL